MFLKIEDLFIYLFYWFNYGVAKSSGKQHRLGAFAIIGYKFVQNCPTRLDE
jgi:hypothetical protein